MSRRRQMEGRKKGGSIVATKYRHCVPVLRSQFSKCIDHLIFCPSSLHSAASGLCLHLWPWYGKAIPAIALYKSNKQRFACVSGTWEIWYSSFSHSVHLMMHFVTTSASKIFCMLNVFSAAFEKRSWSNIKVQSLLCTAHHLLSVNRDWTV